MEMGEFAAICTIPKRRGMAVDQHRIMMTLMCPSAVTLARASSGVGTPHPPRRGTTVRYRRAHVPPVRVLQYSPARGRGGGDRRAACATRVLVRAVHVVSIPRTCSCDIPVNVPPNKMLTAADRQSLAEIGVPRDLRVRCYFNLTTGAGENTKVTGGQWENGRSSATRRLVGRQKSLFLGATLL